MFYVTFYLTNGHCIKTKYATFSELKESINSEWLKIDYDTIINTKQVVYIKID